MYMQVDMFAYIHAYVHMCVYVFFILFKSLTEK